MAPTSKAFKVVQASAGSGKTYTIVKEYLQLCLANEAATNNFKSILAITFTNMAANEMKSKILHQLDDLIHSNDSQDPTGMEADLMQALQIDRPTLKANASRLFQNLIHDYSGFCVCTIDAFVQKLARSFTRDLNLPTRFNVSIDEDDVADAITERIGEQLGTANPFLTHILEDFSEMKFDNEKSPKVAVNINEFITQLFSEESYQKGEQNHFTTEDQYKETLQFLHQRTDGFEQRCKQFIKESEDLIQRHGLTDADFNYRSGGPCLGLLKNIKKRELKPLGVRQLQIISNEINWYSSTYEQDHGKPSEALSDEFDKVFVSFLKYYQSSLSSYLFFQKQLEQLCLYVLRSKIRAEMEAYIEEEQIVLINEFNKRINEVMGDFSVPFIYERLGEHFKHVFIDEFQDTSLLQWQNLIPLFDNNLASQHLNMIVGDGKQSIYRWRNGEVGQIVSLPEIYAKPDDSPIFNQFEETLVNNFDFTELKNNFRSFRNIVDFNNRFFRFSAAAPFLSEQSRKVYVDRDDRYGKEVSIEQQCRKTEEGYVHVELFDPKDEDELMLERIKGIIEEVTAHGFSLKDITILVRRNKFGSMVAEYLNGQGISVISAESILLQSSHKVQLIVNTLDYLIHPTNEAVIATVLYYWHTTHREGFQGQVNGIFDTVKDLAKGGQTLEGLFGMEPRALSTLLARSYSLYDLCSGLMRVYGFQSVDDAYLNFLLNIIDQWQSTDEIGITAFLDYWEQKRSKLSVVTGQADAVSIMTIHKSKGLEFPVVIYPFMNDNLDDSKNKAIWARPQQLGFESIPNVDQVQFTFTKEGGIRTPQIQQLYEEENAKVHLDNLNLNYVAFTRPVQRLYILSYRSNKEGVSPLNAFLDTCPDHQVESGSTTTVYAFGDPDSRKVTSNKSAAVPTEIHHGSTSCEWFDKITVDPEPSMFWVSPDDKMKPQEWGDFVHQVLSEVRHADDIDRSLAPYVDSGVIDSATAALLRQLFLQMASAPKIQKAFGEEAKIKTECEILSKQLGIIRPDRYAELPDKIILIDYKTGKPQSEHHRQLRQYAGVLKGMVAKPIECYLVYLKDEVEVVPVPQDNPPQLTIQF